MSVIQVIDENKQFSKHVNQYFDTVGLSNVGLTYNVVAVFGSQSTGKSTLLNALFGTEFGVMDVAARQQTTKGIWMGSEKPQKEDKKYEPLLVLDVEGTDGRERGEDQDFERKAALFALATSEILIINMWEHQVGLYVGANMALLRTVFEVNLSLFQAGRGQYQRSRILFVIRDHMGLTPLATLAATLTEDLEKQWEALSKPDGLQDARIQDFFDLDFAGLPHKVLQPAEFTSAVTQLRTQLSHSFKSEYHRHVPIDGWPMYAEHVWEQIEMNKDLDLPTHQILVARFRCEEISNEAFAQFEADLASLKLPFGDADVAIADFGPTLRKHRTAALEHYDEKASRYHQSVYNEKRLEILGRVDGVLTAYFGAQLTALKTQALATFKQALEAPGNRFAKSLDSEDASDRTVNVLTFKDRIAAAVSTARTEFEKAASESIIDPSFFSYNVYLQELDAELARASELAREAELRRVLKRIQKTVVTRLDAVDQHFVNFPGTLEHPWDAVQETLNATLRSIRKDYPEDFGLGGAAEETKRSQLLLECLAWRELTNRIDAMVKQDAVLQRLRDRFEDTFKYSEDGLPVVWSPEDDIDAAAVRATKSAKVLLPQLSSAKLSTGELLAPPQHVVDALNQQEDDVPDFAVLLTVQQQQEIERRFQRVADAAFIDAKRSVMQLKTHIPVYVYAIIAVLGWNEFTMVLRNPLLIMLVLMLGGAVYIVHSLGMTTTVLNIIDSTVERSVAEIKEYLRQFLLSEDERRQISARERRAKEKTGAKENTSASTTSAAEPAEPAPREAEPREK